MGTKALSEIIQRRTCLLYQNLSEIQINEGSEKINHSIKSGNIKQYIMDNHCQLYALKAYQRDLISSSEFYTIISLRQLIEDHTELKLLYSNIDSLTMHTCCRYNINI